MQVIRRNSIKDELDDLILHHGSKHIRCIVLNKHEWWDLMMSLSPEESAEYKADQRYRQVKIEKE